MKCVNCGRELPDSAAFCGNCGTPVQPSGQTDIYGSSAEPVTNLYENTENTKEYHDPAAGLTPDFADSQKKKQWKDQYTIAVIIGLCVLAGIIGFVVKSARQPSSQRMADREEMETQAGDDIYDEEAAEEADSEFEKIKEDYESNRIDYAEAKNALAELNISELKDEEAGEVQEFQEMLEENLEEDLKNFASQSDYESLMGRLSRMEEEIDGEDAFLTDMRKKYEAEYIQKLDTESKKLLTEGKKAEAIQKLEMGQSLVEDKDAVSELLLEAQNSAGTGPNDYIIPDSNKKYLTDADISGLNIQQINYAKNEIYARHGRKFLSNELQTYFNSKSWYNGTIEASAFNDNVLNDYEKKNAEKLSSREFSMESGGYKLDQ